MGTFSGETSPIPSFQRVLSACYHAEIDVQYGGASEETGEAQAADAGGLHANPAR